MATGEDFPSGPVSAAHVLFLSRYLPRLVSDPTARPVTVPVPVADFDTLTEAVVPGAAVGGSAVLERRAFMPEVGAAVGRADQAPVAVMADRRPSDPDAAVDAALPAEPGPAPAGQLAINPPAQRRGPALAPPARVEVDNYAYQQLALLGRQLEYVEEILHAIAANSPSARQLVLEVCSTTTSHVPPRFISSLCQSLSSFGGTARKRPGAGAVSPPSVGGPEPPRPAGAAQGVRLAVPSKLSPYDAFLLVSEIGCVLYRVKRVISLYSLAQYTGDYVDSSGQHYPASRDFSQHSTLWRWDPKPDNASRSLSESLRAKITAVHKHIRDALKSQAVAGADDSLQARVNRIVADTVSTAIDLGADPCKGELTMRKFYDEYLNKLRQQSRTAKKAASASGGDPDDADLAVGLSLEPSDGAGGDDGVSSGDREASGGSGASAGMKRARHGGRT